MCDGHELVPRRVAVARHMALYSAGQVVQRAVFIVRFGSFKHTRADQCSRQRITGFHMSGDVLALDSIGLQWYQSAATALEDSEVCVISYDLMRTFPAYFNALASTAIARAQHVSLHLRRTSAPQKLAAFLLDLAGEFDARGYASRHFRLPMRHQDIANFLDITPASMSRLLKQFRLMQLIDASEREIMLRDPRGLSCVMAEGMPFNYGG
ncbi:oxygen-responsive transcriptional regulator Btr [Pseudoduganella ginsengisoli]|nr:helix-turn-helix domain-containing protein [Pseudoduganella ginsengisoli]